MWCAFAVGDWGEHRLVVGGSAVDFLAFDAEPVHFGELDLGGELVVLLEQDILVVTEEPVVVRVLADGRWR